MNRFDINSAYGEIKLGSLRIHWYNSDEDAGFCIFGFGRYNIEFGQIDQERPGIYLTRYVNHDVEQLRTILEL